MSVEEEVTLVKAAQRGDEDAFTTLYKRFQPVVFRQLHHLTRNESQAEDLAQQALTKVFSKIGSFQFKSRFSTWVYIITRREFLMEERRKKPLFASLDALLEDGSPVVHELADPSYDPRLGLPDRDRIEKAMDRLAPGYRLHVRLHDQQGMGHKEIAELRDTHVGNSKSQLYKARVELRKLLRGRFS